MEKTFIRKALVWMASASVVIGAYSCEDDEETKPEPTSVVIKSISAVGDSTFTVNAEVAGEGDVVARGVVVTSVSAFANPKAAADTLYDKSGGNGFFALTEEGLLPNTKYFVRAFAKEQGGDFIFSDEQNVTTQEHVGISVVLDSAIVTDDSLVVKFVISGEDAVVSRGVYFSTQAIDKDNLKDLTPIMASEGGKGELEFTFDKLFRNTEYHVLAFAKDDKGNVIYSDDYAEKTTSVGEAYITIEVESDETTVSLSLTTNDPLTSVILKRGNIDINGEVKAVDAVEGVYYYSAQFTELAEGDYTIVAKTEGATIEAEAKTGRNRLDYTETAVEAADGLTKFHYVHNGKVGTVTVMQLQSASSVVGGLNKITLNDEVVVELNPGYISEDGTSSLKEPEDYLFLLEVNGDAYKLNGGGKTLFAKPM